MDQISDLHPRRTSHLTPFAIHAILEVLVKEKLILKTQSLPIRPSLLRPRIQGVDGDYRAIRGAYRTLDALLEIIGTEVLLLHGYLPAKILSATLMAVIIATPAPLPSYNELHRRPQIRRHKGSLSSVLRWKA